MNKLIDGKTGFNNANLRYANDRVVMRYIFMHGRLSKAELTRLTNLSARTIQLICERLIDQDMVQQHPLEKGKVGQPVTPLSLNPDGAYGIGIKIGRRRLTVQSCNLGFTMADRLDKTYDHITDIDSVKTACDLYRQVRERIQDKNIVGTSIAVPKEYYHYADKIAYMLGEPVTIYPDIHAASMAENWLSNKGLTDYYYFMIGSYFSGCFLLGNEIYGNKYGNISCFEEILFKGQKLGDYASLLSLDKRLRENGGQAILANGLSGAEGLSLTNFSPQDKMIINDWQDKATDALAEVMMTSNYVLRLDSAVIETALPREIHQSFCAMIKQKQPSIAIYQGSVGASARSFGCAIAPLLNFFQPILTTKN